MKKLFRWRVDLGDEYGIVYVLADDVEEARELACERLGVPSPKDCPEEDMPDAELAKTIRDSLAKEPRVFEKSVALVTWHESCSPT